MVERDWGEQKNANRTQLNAERFFVFADDSYLNQIKVKVYLSLEDVGKLGKILYG